MNNYYSKLQELKEDIEALRNLLMSRAQGGNASPNTYDNLRTKLSDNDKYYLPTFIKTCQSLDLFWAFIQTKFRHYAERKDYLMKEFEPVLSMINDSLSNPSDKVNNEVLDKVDSESVKKNWRKCLERRTGDESGALTAAKSLLESVFKYILDEEGGSYEKNETFTALYKKVKNALAALTSCEQPPTCFGSIVHDITELRNIKSDAHGKGKEEVKPTSDEATLAVNLAGSISAFLISTYNKAKGNK